MHFAPRLLAAACALSCVCAPAFAAAPTPAKLTPKDNALHILQKGLKSADFTSRGMAYRSLALDKTNKEAKKQPALSPKEKKQAKQAKKHSGDAAPLMQKGS